MKLQHIVVGVDFSAPSIATAKWVARYFTGAKITLVHSVFVPQPPSFLRGRLPAAELLVESAREGAVIRLEQLRSLLGGADVAVQVRVGQPAGELAKAAHDGVADLLVVGRHGEREGVWRHLGSTAERLVRSSPVPVLLVPGLHDHRPSRILVAIDDSDTTPRVMAAASVLAERFGARTIALHVVSSAVLSHVLSMAAASGQDDMTPQEVQEEFRLDTDRWIQALIDAGVPRVNADSEVAFGNPGQEILAAGERLGCDLIVIGSRGAGTVRRALLGSTVSEVVRGATSPVFIVAEPEDAIVPRLTDEELAADLPAMR
jgi:nucleotide-binding universal stress UspA family protein